MYTRVWSRFFTLRQLLALFFPSPLNAAPRAVHPLITDLADAKGIRPLLGHAAQPSQLCKNGITTNRVWFSLLAACKKGRKYTQSVPSTQRLIKGK
jgi:hypothetical protein